MFQHFKAFEHRQNTQNLPLIDHLSLNQDLLKKVDSVCFDDEISVAK